jgi:hypothetical protein
MYVFIYCKWTQVRWQNYIDINNLEKHVQSCLLGYTAV